jgi:hypothetical protein
VSDGIALCLAAGAGTPYHHHHRCVSCRVVSCLVPYRVRVRWCVCVCACACGLGADDGMSAWVRR